MASAAAPPASIRLTTLVRAAHDGVDAATRGALLGLLVDTLGLSRSALLRLLLETNTFTDLQSPEFVDALGSHRLRSKQVLHVAFESSSGAGAGCAAVLALNAAGALDLFESSVVEELHLGITGWGGDAALQAACVLLVGLVGELESFDQAGIFLAAFVGCRGSSLSPETMDELLAAVIASPDVRDLAGEPRDLGGHLPDHAAVVDAALAAAAAGGSDADSDGDAAGNLADFVCDDDEVAFDTGAEEEEEQEERANRRRAGALAAGARDSDNDDDDDRGDHGGGEDDDVVRPKRKKAKSHSSSPPPPPPAKRKRDGGSGSDGGGKSMRTGKGR